MQLLLPLKSKKVLHILGVCSLRYAACNVHAPCHPWPICLYSILPHYLANDTIFKKELLNIKCVFQFSLQLLCETCLILRRNM